LRRLTVKLFQTLSSLLGVKQEIVAASVFLSALLSLVILLAIYEIGTPPAVAEAASEPPQPRLSEPAAYSSRSGTNLEPVFRNLVTQAGHVNRKAVRALAAAGERVVPEVLERLAPEDTPFQQGLLAVLAKLQDDRIPPALLGLLNEAPPPGITDRIVVILQRYLNPDLCTGVASLANSAHETTRLAAARLLSRCGGPEAALVLLRLLKRDPQPQVRIRALESLAERPSGALQKAVAAAVTDEDPKVRAACARLIGRHTLIEYEDQVVYLLEGDPDPAVRRAARTALSLLRLARARRAGHQNSR